MTANRFRFRAWDPNKKRMFVPCEYDNVFLDLECGEFYSICGPEGETYTLPLDHLVPLQSTGLLDKNGKEIFEGDILQWDDIISQVVWSTEDTALVLRDKNGDGAFLNQEYCLNYTVIGNIYENPNTSP